MCILSISVFGIYVWLPVVEKHRSDCICGWKCSVELLGSLHATWKLDHVWVCGLLSRRGGIYFLYVVV